MEDTLNFIKTLTKTLFDVDQTYTIHLKEIWKA